MKGNKCPYLHPKEISPATKGKKKQNKPNDDHHGGKTVQQKLSQNMPKLLKQLPQLQTKDASTAKPRWVGTGFRSQSSQPKKSHRSRSRQSKPGFDSRRSKASSVPPSQKVDPEFNYREDESLQWYQENMWKNEVSKKHTKKFAPPGPPKLRMAADGTLKMRTSAKLQIARDGVTDSSEESPVKTGKKAWPNKIKMVRDEEALSPTQKVASIRPAIDRVAEFLRQQQSVVDLTVSDSELECSQGSPRRRLPRKRSPKNLPYERLVEKSKQAGIYSSEEAHKMARKRATDIVVSQAKGTLAAEIRYHAGGVNAVAADFEVLESSDEDASAPPLLSDPGFDVQPPLNRDQFEQMVHDMVTGKADSPEWIAAKAVDPSVDGLARPLAQNLALACDARDTEQFSVQTELEDLLSEQVGNQDHMKLIWKAIARASAYLSEDQRVRALCRACAMSQGGSLWLVDTAASQCVAGASAQPQNIVPSDEEVNTSNGPAKISHGDAYIPFHSDIQRATVLPNSPNLLSVGELIEHGKISAFTWDKQGCKIHKGRKSVQLDVENNVPKLIMQKGGRIRGLKFQQRYGKNLNSMLAQKRQHANAVVADDDSSDNEQEEEVLSASSFDSIATAFCCLHSAAFSRFKDSVKVRERLHQELGDHHSLLYLLGMVVSSVYDASPETLPHNTTQPELTGHVLDQWLNVEGFGFQRSCSHMAVKKHNMVTHEPPDPTCKICIYTKLKHKPRSSRNQKQQSQAKPKGERVHCDTQGPITPESLDGHQYSQTQFEERADYLSVFEKAGTTAEECTRLFRAHYSGKQKPQICKTDGGPEFSDKFRDMLSNLDIGHQLSCPNEASTHGLIGVVQGQMNQAVRAMIYQARCPASLWALCQTYYALARNVFRGAFQQKFGKKFSGPLPPFGCEAIYKIRDQAHSDEKFAPSGRSAVFVGYSEHGHVQVLDYEGYMAGRTQNLVRSVRTVKFRQSDFPFSQLDSDMKEDFGRLVVGTGDPRCATCGLFITDDPVKCKACKGQKRKHSRNQWCKLGRCKCKPSLDILISGETQSNASSDSELSGGDSDVDSDDELSGDSDSKSEDDLSDTESYNSDAATPVQFESVSPKKKSTSDSPGSRRKDSAPELSDSDREPAAASSPVELSSDSDAEASVPADPSTVRTPDKPQISRDGRVIRPHKSYWSHGLGREGTIPGSRYSPPARPPRRSGTTPMQGRTSQTEEFSISSPTGPGKGANASETPSLEDLEYAAFCEALDAQLIPPSAYVTMDLTKEDRVTRSAELQAARLKEIEKHIREKSVDFKNLREEEDVKAEDPRATFMKLKFVDAKSGLEMDTKGTFKSRIVGQGCNHVDVDGHQVKIAEAGLYADPASLEEAMLGLSLAGLCTRVGKLKIEQKDRSSAYLKEKLLGDAVWMRLDQDTKKLVPGAEKLKNPVVRAIGAVYGISRAGFDHESGRNQKIRDAGWKLLTGSRSVWYREFKLAGNTKSSYRSESAFLILIVYVDDFLLAGDEDAFQAAWKTLDGMGWKPDPPDRFLGVQYHVTVEDNCNVIWLGQEEYSVYIRKNYLDKTNIKKSSLRNAKTPAQEWIVYTDDQLTEPGVEVESFLRRMIGLLLYLARATRPEVKYSVTRLARLITKWTQACDLELRRLVGYLQWRPDWGTKLKMSPSEWRQGLVRMIFHVDADHGNSCIDRRSISGMNFGLFGEKTKALVGGHSKAQKVAERSSGGTELNGISAGVSTFFRFDDMFMTLAKKFCQLVKRSVVGSDSAVAISVVRNGYSKAFYHLSKHQGTEVAFLHDVFFPPEKKKSPLELAKVASAENKADCNTKPLPYQNLEEACDQIGCCRLPPALKKLG